MSISDPNSSNLISPVAVWSQVDASHAQVSLSGAVNVYSLAGVWSDVRKQQNNSFFPYYILQISIEEFYGDYRVRPEAIVTIEFFLTATDPQKRNPVIGKNRYSKRVALKDSSPQALVQGQQEALAQILKEYEVVLYKYAGNLPPPLGQ
ncbi:ABC-type transport auxiliary lipoprotein family protein [Polynucleobacter bastaniensis]|uniref:ABC-type transport auxiliary lipoprotein family protein n=1 Tax=Polynucleobacter bastaniensis TaxID=2081039 RepID=UPI001C0D96BF|nr:ABC-type transport auxiliary lipoprotein family protein [Polynucleobacter bastaniensis]